MWNIFCFWIGGGIIMTMMFIFVPLVSRWMWKRKPIAAVRTITNENISLDKNPEYFTDRAGNTMFASKVICDRGTADLFQDNKIHPIDSNNNIFVYFEEICDTGPIAVLPNGSEEYSFLVNGHRSSVVIRFDGSIKAQTWQSKDCYTLMHFNGWQHDDSMGSDLLTALRPYDFSSKKKKKPQRIQ